MSDFLARLEELNKAATPGPWRVYHNGQIVVDGEDADGPTVTLVLDRKDTELLVHLRNHVPEIVALVKAARIWADKRCELPLFLGSEIEYAERWNNETYYQDCGECASCLARAALEALDK